MVNKLKNYIIFIVVFLMVFIVACDNSASSNEYIVKINSEEIYESEYRVYLYESEKNFETLGGEDIWYTDFDGQSAEDVAKEMAFNSLKIVKISSIKARENGTVLTNEELLRVQQEAENIFNSLTDYEKETIPKDTIAKVMAEKALYEKYRDEIIQNYIVSEADFNQFCIDNEQQYMDSYKMLTLNTILIGNKEKAQEALERIISGENFLKIADEYEIDEDAKQAGSYIIQTKGQIENVFGISIDFGVGETAPLIESSEGYYILKLEKEEPADKESVDIAMRLDYETLMKQEIFETEYNKWLVSIDIERNNEVYDSVKVKE